MMEGILNRANEILVQYGFRVIAAIAIFIIGRFVAGLLRKLVRRVLKKSDTDEMVAGFLANLMYNLILTVTILAILNSFGMETTSLVAILGAVTFAVGFALKDSLANFAAGIMLLIFKPFTVGNFVEAGGTAGVVKSISLFSTTLNSPDNIRIIVPNGNIFGGTIKNFSAEETRRIDMVIGISYDASIKDAVAILEKLMAADSRILTDPAPGVAVGELADSSVNFNVRPWVKNADYWGVKGDLTRQIKESFDEAGIEIPFPQMVVHSLPVSGKE